MSFVYRKDEEVESEEVWDDTELIQLYERSISATYNKIGAAAASSEWAVGDSCLARYTEDELYYPAKILDIREETVDQPGYLVCYEGYGNTEWVSSDEIIPATSEDGSPEDGNATMTSAPGDAPSRRGSIKGRSKKERQKASGSWSRMNNIVRSNPTIPLIAPPPPTVMASMSVPDEVEALSSMLMSWYMSGYHTGYYQAVKDMKSKK